MFLRAANNLGGYHRQKVAIGCDSRWWYQFLPPNTIGGCSTNRPRSLVIAVDENDELDTLLRQSQVGDPGAHESPLGLLRARARRYADHLLGGQFGAWSAASDMAQEVFVRIGDGFDLSLFPSAPHLLDWLNTVVRNAGTMPPVPCRLGPGRWP